MTSAHRADAGRSPVEADREAPVRSPARGLAAAAAGIAVGAGLVLLAASRVWSSQTVAQPPPLRPQEIVHTGASLAPALPALGLVALAGAGGLLATRGLARRLVGALLVAVALAVVAIVAGELGGGVSPVWPTAGIVGAVAVGAGGLLTLRDGDRWPVMGARYSRPSTMDRPASAWDAIDRGEDPTAGP